MLSNEEAEQWLDGLTAFDRDNKTILFCIFAAFGIPDSYLDVGSGTGVMVNTAEKLNVPIVNGLDQLPRPNHPKLIQHDLRVPYQFPNQFTIVTSIETAEHIDPEYADVLVATICNNASHRIIFTAAMPGQIGHGHVNCQPMYYWREKFWQHGFDYNPPDTWRLATLLSNAYHSSHHVEANLSVFIKNGLEP